VHVMDSLALFSKMNQATVLQIARIYSRTVPPSQSFFTIERLSVQQQDGTLDCGLFAVANAVEVCLNSNPVSAQYDQKKMRRHLEDCLNDETLRSFPCALQSHYLVLLAQCIRSSSTAFAECRKSMMK